jgi:UDP-3-O-[3-hydroxymyristoyl] glucosamine N-acyltransferase
MLTTTSSLVQQVKIRQRRSPQTQSRGVGGVWWAGIQGNVNVGGNTIISGEVGVSGDANVDGGMNVVGNADICGMLCLPRDEFVQHQATTASSSSTSGRWRCLAEREYKET